MKTLLSENVEKLKRKYFEVFGDLETQCEFLKFMNRCLFGLVFLALTGGFLLAKRPPVVIRVNEVGKAEAIENILAHNTPSEPEILYFAKSFTHKYTEHNAYTLSRDISDAMNMMSSAYQKTARRELVDSGVLARVKEAGINTQIEIKEQTIERQTPEYVSVSLIGVRTLGSFKNPDFKQASLFKAEILCRKTGRSIDLPWGLLVEDYHEITLNKLEGSK